MYLVTNQKIHLPTKNLTMDIIYDDMIQTEELKPKWDEISKIDTKISCS